MLANVYSSAEMEVRMIIKDPKTGVIVSTAKFVVEKCIDSSEPSLSSAHRTLLRVFTGDPPSRDCKQVMQQIVDQERQGNDESWTDTEEPLTAGGITDSPTVPRLLLEQVFNIRTELVQPALLQELGLTTLPKAVMLVDASGELLFSGAVYECLAAMMDGSEFQYLMELSREPHLGFRTSP